jgi:hypothetical protein
MSKKTVLRVVVTIDEGSLKRTKVVAGELRSAGMKVEKILPKLGFIAGKVHKDKLKALKKISGVAAIELDQEMNAM